MESWHWWLLIVISIYLISRAVSGNRKAEPKQAPHRNHQAFRDNLRQRLDNVRQRDAAVDRELAKVAGLILRLPVVRPDPAYPSTLTANDIAPSVTNFMQSAGRTGASTSTKMLHVVMSPVGLTAFVKVRPTRPQAAVREFIRISDEKWAYRTWPTDDMDRVIAAAEKAASRSTSFLGILFDIDGLGGGFY